MDRFDIFTELDNLLKNEDVLKNDDDINKLFSDKIENRGVRAPEGNKTKKQKISDKDKKNKSVEEEEDLENSEFDEDYDEEEKKFKEKTEIKDIQEALKFNSLVKALNYFRSSHSLSDPEVKEDLNNFFERLSDNEKKALYIFIKALTRVATPESHAKDTKLLKDFGINISSANKQNKKEDSDSKKKVSKEKENIDIVPIKTESSQDKTEIYNFLIENR
jgi:hypothetical protein